MTDQSGWGSPTVSNDTDTNETETSEAGMSKEEKAERKEAKQRLKISCLSYACQISDKSASVDEVVDAANKFYSFVNGTKYTKKEI